MKTNYSCWICSDENCALSKCPQSWGMHKHPNPSSKWEKATKYKSIYFPGEILAYLCFKCAH